MILYAMDIIVPHKHYGVSRGTVANLISYCYKVFFNRQMVLNINHNSSPENKQMKNILCITYLKTKSLIMYIYWKISDYNKNKNKNLLCTLF